MSCASSRPFPRTLPRTAICLTAIVLSAWLWSTPTAAAPVIATRPAADEQPTESIAPAPDHDPVARSHVVIAIYSAAIVASSLFGGWLPSLMQLTHVRMQTLISGVAGLMLGIAVFHLLPHAIQKTNSPAQLAQWVMAGLLAMFFLIRIFHFHHHGPTEHLVCEHEHDIGHDHAGHEDTVHGVTVHKLNWVGVALGLGLHTLIDGFVLAASVRSESGTDVRWSLYGFATFLAIVLHKPLDAVSITSLMAGGGWSNRARNIVNGSFAMMCPLGVLIFLLGLERLPADQDVVVGCALAFAAGVFLCISLGDLLPEVELHSHHRVRLSLALLAGIAAAYIIEKMHTHAPPLP